MLRRPLTALRLSAALVLATTVLVPALPLPSAWTTCATAFAQGTGDQATLETRQPEVQWSLAGASDWQAVPSRQTVSVGDRVRTGTGASARLIYFEGSVTELSADTALRVDRLERSPDGNIVTRLFQNAGTTLNRVIRLTDPARQLRHRDAGGHGARARHHATGNRRQRHRQLAGVERSRQHGRPGAGARHRRGPDDRHAAARRGDHHPPWTGAVHADPDEQPTAAATTAAV